MKFLFAPDSFKGSLTAMESCDILERVTGRLFPGAETVSVPVADGGEGTVEALLRAMGGERVRTEVTGPLFERETAEWGLLADGTAVMWRTPFTVVSLMIWMLSCILKQRWMVFFEFRQDLGHDGFAEKGGLRMDLETGAVFIYGGHFAVVEIQDIAVLPEEGSLLFLQVGRVHARDFSFSCHRVQR